MEISQEDMIAIELRTDREAKDSFPAYVLWFFLGWLGAHRFFIGETKTGLAMLILSLSMVGFPITFVWWLTDAIRLGGLLQEKRDLVSDRIARETLELKELY
ncbi:TM2 domain-containing protein [Aquidulcibacter sp.]|uniref:TM2 domain-containing protein n=1 Tax=Aquidulcibacter sp. TaxID=2052990 RepID=UPI0028AF6023|nr:TM2 domain-containing protein [Aquidulcibacter sp.]